MGLGAEIRDSFTAQGKEFAGELRSLDSDSASTHGAVQFALVAADLVDSARSTAAALTQGDSVAVADLRQAASADLKRAAVKGATGLVKKSVVTQVTAQAIARGLAEKAAKRVGGGVGHAAVKLGGLALRGEPPSRNDMIEVAATTTLTLGLSFTPLTPWGAGVVTSVVGPRLRKWLDSRS